MFIFTSAAEIAIVAGAMSGACPATNGCWCQNNCKVKRWLVSQRESVDRWSRFGSGADWTTRTVWLCDQHSIQDGTLLIESSVDDVTVRISQGDTVVRKLSVNEAGTKIDVADR